MVPGAIVGVIDNQNDIDAPQEKALHEELSNKPPRLNKQKRGQLLQTSKSRWLNAPVYPSRANG